MARIRLDDRAVKQARTSGVRTELWDTLVVGLQVLVTQNGAATYYIRYRIGDKRRRFKIGRYDRVTLTDARSTARDLFREIERGADPQADRRASRERGLTIEVAFERFLAEPGTRGPRKPRTIEHYRQVFRDHIAPTLGKTRLDAVTRQDVERLKVATFRQVGKGRGHGEPGKAVANRTLAVLSAILGAAERWGTIPTGSNPCQHVSRYCECPRETFLSPWDRAGLEHTLAQEEKRKSARGTVLAIRLLSLTGCRKNDIVTLRWDQVHDLDGDRPSLHLKDAKNGPVTIPLTPQAVELLKANRPRRVDPKSLVCGNRRRGRGKVRPLSNLGRSWSQIRRKAQIPNTRLHDLRHSLASDALNSGVPLAFVGAMLGHKHHATTERYAHLAQDALRREVAVAGKAIEQNTRIGQAQRAKKAS